MKQKKKNISEKRCSLYAALLQETVYKKVLSIPRTFFQAVIL